VPQIAVASYNIFGGVDGWGRPHDVASTCRQLDADVLVVEEDWCPVGEESLAEALGPQLGYTVLRLPLANGARLGPPPVTSKRWRPSRLGSYRAAVRLDDERSRWRWRDGDHERNASRGAWGVALLSRLPVLRWEALDLGRLRRDPSHRGVLCAEIEVSGRHLSVFGTHFSHLTHGSLVQLSRLRSVLPDRKTPAVLAGDMNLWGPPLSVLLPGWRRAVRARTWPAWRPLAQIDHILVTPPVGVVRGEVLPIGGSDHRPVRAVLDLA
jgi:endonuclease/exonuclease/phosphatase family metal-dependent hydrolase